MRVLVVGSTNPVKVGAVQASVEGLAAFKGASVVGLSVPSGVSEQPKTLQDSFQGAQTRAKNAMAAHPGANWGVGLEDGMYPCPVEPGRYLNVCVACVVGPQRVSYGTSSSFPYPPNVVRRVLEEGMDVSQALRAEGLTDNPKVGADVGAIGVLSRGRLVRKDYTQQAVTAALLPWYSDLG